MTKQPGQLLPENYFKPFGRIKCGHKQTISWQWGKSSFSQGIRATSDGLREQQHFIIVLREHIRKQKATQEELFKGRCKRGQTSYE